MRPPLALYARGGRTTTKDYFAKEAMIDSRRFREVLSAYPAGVCVVAAQAADGRKHAMFVGSCSSISLDPLQVCCYPTKASSSRPATAEVGRFRANVLNEKGGVINCW